MKKTLTFEDSLARLEEIVARLNAFHPLFIEEIPVDFEELFTYEVESRGYLK